MTASESLVHALETLDEEIAAIVAKTPRLQNSEKASEPFGVLARHDRAQLERLESRRETVVRALAKARATVTLTLPLQGEMLRLFVYANVSGARQASDNICTIEVPSAASTSLAALGMLTISELDEDGVHLWTLEATGVGERYLAELLAGASAAKVPRLPLADERVLVVEDDQDSGDMLSFALRRAGAETRLTTSAHAARAVLILWEPTIIVSDLMMPGENGFALIESIRADPRTRHIAAIALTGMAEDSARDRALSSGFQLHVVKPVNLATLIRLMANLTAPIPTAA